MSMQAISELSAKQQEMMERNRQYDQRKKQEWEETATAKNWPLDANCRMCGDTGWHAEWNIYCPCSAGTTKQNRRKLLDFWNAHIPKRFQDYRLETSPSQAAAAKVREWIDREPWKVGENLLLIGPVGTGKTGLIIGAAWTMYERGRQINCAGVPMMLDQMRPPSKNDPMQELVNCRILLLDDLGSEKPSDWVKERLYVLINGRYEAKKSTIVTTNCDLGQLADAIGERTVSRLQEGATIVPVAGKDQRRG